MVKKHIRHFNRGVIIGLEFLGLIVFALFVAWLFLIIRLSQGPMDVNFLTKNIERGLNSQQSGFVFDIGSTLLAWGGATEPFEFEVKHVQISRGDKTPVLSVEKIGIQLSKRYLVFGRFVPRVIKIYSPAVRIIRSEDGQLLLNMNNAATAPAVTTGDSQTPAHTDFMRSLLVQMKDTGTFNLLAGLEQVVVTDAAVLYEDRRLNVKWKSGDSDIIFTRQRGGLMVDVVANMEMDQGHQAYMRGSFYYSWQTFRPNGVIYFTGVNPSLIAQQSERLKDIVGIDLPLKGSISFEMDKNFNLGYGRFVLGAEQGKFNALGLYREPMPVKKFYMQGRFDGATKEAHLEQLRLDMGGPTLEVKGELKKQDDGHLIQVNALLQNMSLDRVQYYWPETLAVDARRWVTGHLSAGVAGKSTLNLSMLAPKGDFKNLKLQKVGGQIDFSGIKVDYFSPLMPVTKVGGRAVYDEKNFNIDVSGGMLGDMQVGKSKVNISGLDIQDEKVHANIDIDANVKGPLKTALTVLDTKPLQYLQKLGVDRAGVGGDADVNVNLKFPLYDKLQLQEIKVTAKAKVNDVTLKKVALDLDLTGGPLEVSLETGVLKVKGRGVLGSMPVDFHWLNNFLLDAKIASKAEAKLSLNAATLSKFGVPDYFRLSGSLPSDVTYTVAKDHSVSLILKGDITPLSFSVPVSSYEKKEETGGKIAISLLFNKDGKLSRIADLDLSVGTGHVKGNIDFAADGQSVYKASFSEFRLGDTDIAIDLSHSVGKEGYAIKVTGKQFDASNVLSGDDKPNSNEEAAIPVTPITVSMAVDRLMTGPEKHIEQVKMFMRRNGWSRLEQLDVSGVSGGQPISLHYIPLARGHTLQFEAGNAGAALRALGISNGIRGGKVVVNAQPLPKGGPREMQGSVTMTDFTAVDIPALGRLLNAMSLTGIVELLKGKGISFKKMQANFQWIDRGQPETDQNVRIIRLRNGETSGASLGLTFEGAIDNWSNTLDINGTIIPVSDLNKLVSVIPLVGNILTGGGKGVFAATYTVKGPKAEPTVTVNPLAVLAPGIFRKLFFEK